MAHQQRRLTDPRALRAVAHPVRMSILEQLVVRGALTASDLADLIDESPANCSWHLRKLAEHGFVEEAGGGRGRQRPWRAVAQGMSWGGIDDTEEAALAGDALTRTMLERELDRLADARVRLRTDDPAWREGADVCQSALWLTAQELRELNDAVRRLFTDKLDRHDHPERRPPAARYCRVVQWGIPAYGWDDASPTAEDR